MNRLGSTLFICVLLAAVTAAQSGAQSGAQATAQTASTSEIHERQASASGSTTANASTQSSAGSAALTGGNAFNVALNNSVDSKNAKSGDTVIAHTTESVKHEGKVLIPKGAKLVGHVTQSSARAKGDANSALAIQFDKAILKNGSEMPLNVAIRAIASAQTAASAGSDLDAAGGAGAYVNGSGSSGRGAVGGLASAAGRATGSVTNTVAGAGTLADSTVNTAANTTAGAGGAATGAVGGLNSAGQLTSNSQGVFGLNGLNLNGTETGSAQGALITSAGKNVHLDGGTRMLLVTQAATSGTPNK
jgi:fibronectin-binding autotransporter adhesin